MVSFFVNASGFTAVFSKLISNPLYILKPLSTWNDPDPLFFTLFLLKIMGIWAYYKNVRTDNCSYVDCVWSIAPILYAGSMVLHYFVHNDGVLHERLTLMFLLIVGWGVRLTYNLYIKGGYKKTSEDHRWRLIRTWFQGKPVQWQLFIFFVVNVYQMLSIWAFSVLPLYIVYHGPARTQLYDLPLAIAFCVFLGIETIADFQMFEYQEGKKQHIRKREFKQTGDHYSNGFFCEGLYRYSRHPNYFGELGQWWMLYLLSCVGAKKVVMLNWSVVGVVNLCLILYKSMNLTESITDFKYPKYKIYARRTAQLILWPPGPEMEKKKQ